MGFTSPMIERQIHPVLKPLSNIYPLRLSRRKYSNVNSVTDSTVGDFELVPISSRRVLLSEGLYRNQGETDNRPITVYLETFSNELKRMVHRRLKEFSFTRFYIGPLSLLRGKLDPQYMVVKTV